MLNLNLFTSWKQTISSIPTRLLGVALPSDDVALNGPAYNIVPRVGQSKAKSFFQKDMEDSIESGMWKPKLLLLPDIGKFEIKLNAYNAALLANGILSRYPSEVTLYKNRNRRMNRYLIYCYWRLKQTLGQAKYWEIAIHLIRNSSVYQTVCMHSVDKNIYRKLRQRDLKRLIERLNAMRANFHFKETLWSDNVHPLKAMRHYVRFYRVYIPKTETTVRPLGVPTRAWRIYQKMWLMPVMGFTGHLIPPQFHGYIPRRGTGTAWQTILKTVIHRDTIFELDFKGFFPSVPTAELTSALYLEGLIPLPVCVYLHYMNNSLPMFMTEDKLPETKYNEGHESALILDQIKLKLGKPVVREQLIKGISTTGLRSPESKLVNAQLVLNNPLIPYSYKSPQYVPGLVPSQLENTIKTGLSLIKELEPKLAGNPVGLESFQAYDLNYQQLKWQASRGIPLGRLTLQQRDEMMRDLANAVQTRTLALAKHLLGSNISFGVGLPQGATLSPYLSILYLEIVLRRLGKPKDVEYLFYADDGIFYSDNYESISNWIRMLGGNAALPTSLAHYNIRFATEKCRYVKVRGEWRSPLKFLGLKFIYNGSLAASQLVACTRPKLQLGPEGFFYKSSSLEFTKQSLVAYTYLISLLDKSKGYLEYRRSLARHPSTAYYYSVVISLIGTSRVSLDYLYLLARVVLTGVPTFVVFLSSKAYLLTDYITLKNILSSLDSYSEGLKVIECSSLDPDDKTKIFKAVEYLEGGYKGSFLQPRASDSLLRQLERGLSSISLSDLPVVKVESSVDEQLVKLMAAPLFFDLSLNDAKLWILRQIPVGKFEYDKFVPLDLFRFFFTIVIPVFSMVLDLSRLSISKGSESLAQLKRYSQYQTLLQLRHQFSNLADSRYFGLIMSRLYSGSWLPDDINQSFKYTYEEQSLAEFLAEHDHDRNLNVFVGSSYAFHEVVRLTSHLKRSSRTKAPFHLFPLGYLEEKDWDVSGLSLASPSLAQEFPGGQEPLWHETP